MALITFIYYISYAFQGYVHGLSGSMAGIACLRIQTCQLRHAQLAKG